jgi:hypothetical protein
MVNKRRKRGGVRYVNACGQMHKGTPAGHTYCQKTQGYGPGFKCVGARGADGMYDGASKGDCVDNAELEFYAYNIQNHNDKNNNNNGYNTNRRQPHNDNNNNNNGYNTNRREPHKRTPSSGGRRRKKRRKTRKRKTRKRKTRKRKTRRRKSRRRKPRRGGSRKEKELLRRKNKLGEEFGFGDEDGWPCATKCEQKNFCSRLMGCDYNYYCNKANKNFQVATNEVMKCSNKKNS